MPVAIAAFLLKVSFKILGWLIGICFTLALLISLLLISVMGKRFLETREAFFDGKVDDNESLDES